MSIVGSIVERKPTSSVRPVSTTSLDTGFPTVQHRSKSAFTRNREEKRNAVTRNNLSRLNHVPIVIPSASDLLDPSSNDANWRNQVGKENEERVARMDDTEREEEKFQILERFGANIGDVLKRARLARERQKQTEKPLGPVNLTPGCCLFLQYGLFFLYSFLDSFG